MTQVIVGFLFSVLFCLTFCGSGGIDIAEKKKKHAKQRKVCASLKRIHFSSSENRFTER